MMLVRYPLWRPPLEKRGDCGHGRRRSGPGCRPDATGSAPLAPAVDDPHALRAAYEQVGQSRPFVRIHRLRAHLQWPRDRFDRLLRQRRADYVIELHGGDPSQLSEAEVRDSFSQRF